MTRRRGPARSAKVVTGAVTSLAFVSMVSGLHIAGTAAEAAEQEIIRQNMAREASIRSDLRLAGQIQAITAAAERKAAAKARAAAKKAAAARARQLAAVAPVFIPVRRATTRTAPRPAPRPAPKRAANPAPVDGSSGGS